MPTEVVITLISEGVALVGIILSFIGTQKKSRNEQLKRLEDFQIKQQEQITSFQEKQQEQIANFQKTEREEVSYMQDMYAEKINDLNRAIEQVQASMQQAYSETGLRYEFLTKEFREMKEEVKEHNNFAKRMPVVEERLKSQTNVFKTWNDMKKGDSNNERKTI